MRAPFLHVKVCEGNIQWVHTNIQAFEMHWLYADWSKLSPKNEIEEQNPLTSLSITPHDCFIATFEVAITHREPSTWTL